MKQTVLHPQHVRAGAVMTEFQGWRVPARFVDPADEYHAVRTAAGLFDVGFLGRIELSGGGAEAALQRVFTRNVAQVAEGAAIYGLLCNDRGGIIDAVLLFRLPSARSGPRFLVTTSAVATDRVRTAISAGARADLLVAENTGSLAQFALQGPRAGAILEAATGHSVKRLKRKNLKEFQTSGDTLLISRTGFTGERGVELFIAAEQAGDLWRRLLEAGKDQGVLPCGMTCREMLRVEAGYALAGNELDESRNPVDAGLLTIVDKEAAFAAKPAIAEFKARGPEHKLVGFELLDKGIPSPGGTIYSGGSEIGVVTSGVHSIARRRDVGLGYVLARYSQPGQEIEVEMKGRETTAKIVALPFYRKR